MDSYYVSDFGGDFTAGAIGLLLSISRGGGMFERVEENFDTIREVRQSFLGGRVFVILLTCMRSFLRCLGTRYQHVLT